MGNAPVDGTGVFDGNSGLTSVTRSATATGWGLTWSGLDVTEAEVSAVFTYTEVDGNVTVTGCISTCPADLVIPATLDGNLVTTIGDSAFYDNDLTSVTIPDSVTTIGAGAFSTNLIRSLTLGASVTTIGDVAFYDNYLTSVTIPDSVTTIGASAFEYSILDTVTIGNSVTTIGDYAF